MSSQLHQPLIYVLFLYSRLCSWLIYMFTSTCKQLISQEKILEDEVNMHIDLTVLIIGMTEMKKNISTSHQLSY